MLQKRITKSTANGKGGKQKTAEAMNWWRNFGLGVLFWIGIAIASKSKNDVEAVVLQSIMPPNGKVLEAFLISRFPTSLTIEVLREFILDYFAKNLPDWHREVDTFTDDTPIGKIRFQNLIFTQNVHAKEKIVLAAHYDSKYSLNEKEGALPDGFIGATDSAWPCSLLLYLARILDLNKQKKKHKDVTFQVILFDGEESIRSWNAKDSLYGSRRLAAKWKGNKEPPHGVPSAPPFTLESISLFVLFDLLGAIFPLIVHRLKGHVDQGLDGGNTDSLSKPVRNLQPIGQGTINSAVWVFPADSTAADRVKSAELHSG